MSKIVYSPAGAGCGGSGAGRGGSGAREEKPPAVVPLELHACVGLNACKGHDRLGTNECAGTGVCATNAHVCHTLNNCRGQGGCGLYGDAAEQCRPGENDCAFQGSCATPIQAERIATMGPSKGKSVWLLARERFEQRMRRANRNFGDSPFPNGPPQSWLTKQLGEYDSCGYSGDKYCTFGFNNPDENAQKMIDKSKRKMHKTLDGCDCVIQDDAKKKKGDKKRHQKQR